MLNSQTGCDPGSRLRGGPWKWIALAPFLFAFSAFAAEAPVLPPDHLCFKAMGLPDRTACLGGTPIDYSQFPVADILAASRNVVFFLGFDAANAYYPPPLTRQQEAQRELGRKVMDAAPYLAFPELGDPITKDTPAVAYCSSSVGNDALDPFNAQNVRATGKGRCVDFMTVYLRPAGK